MLIRIFALLCFLSVASSSLSDNNGYPFHVTETASLNAPWAMEFLPSGKMLVSEMSGKLKLLDENGAVLNDITGVPSVVFEGQGGFGDIKLHPRFEQNQLLYFSYAEKGTGDLAGAIVARAKLKIEEN